MGQAADFTVLDRALLLPVGPGAARGPSPEQWLQVKVDLTVVGGQLAHRRAR